MNRFSGFLCAATLSAGILFLFPLSSNAAAKDACSLVTSADAQEALGEPVGPSRSQPRSMNGADGTVCKFRSTQGGAMSAKSVSVTVEYSSSDISGNTKGMMDNLKSAGYSNVKEVSGIGDGAVWATNTVMGKPTAELSVLKGKTIMLMISISGFADEASALDRAKHLANKILPRA